MILGRLRCCLTACTKIMSRYWQYLFDIYINNEKFVLNALRSSMFHLRQYLKYAESSPTLDPWPVDRRSVGYHDGNPLLTGDPLQNFSLWGTADIHHLMPFLEHYSTFHTRRHQRGRNNLFIPISWRSSTLMVVLIVMRTIFSYALVWWCWRKTYATAYDRVIGVVIVCIIMTVLSRVPHASRIR